MDARQIRTRASLAETILTLASERPVTDLTISEIAIATGVHRSTFYEHAASPAVLLQDVLREQLDVIRETFLRDIQPGGEGAAVDATTRAVLEHVDRYDVIYQRGLGEDSGSASLHAMLSLHFQGSVRMLVDQHNLQFPGDGVVVYESASRYVADGTVGAIAVWLDTAKPRNRDGFMAQFDYLLPSWWPRANRADAAAETPAQ